MHKSKHVRAEKKKLTLKDLDLYMEDFRAYCELKVFDLRSFHFCDI